MLSAPKTLSTVEHVQVVLWMTEGHITILHESDNCLETTVWLITSSLLLTIRAFNVFSSKERIYSQKSPFLIITTVHNSVFSQTLSLWLCRESSTCTHNIGKFKRCLLVWDNAIQTMYTVTQIISKCLWS